MYSKYKNHDKKLNKKLLVKSTLSVGFTSVLFYFITVLTFTI